jgi:alpha-galactosidase
MKLGLWMSPMHFNPASKTYQQHPEWACAPLGHALVAANVADPDGGSNEAGLGMWGPDAIPHIENRIRDAIENWHVGYFKFDFLVWADCAGQGDLYDYHDRFVAMLDRLKADHPDVTFQIDETNDYRLFPFDSVDRGPSWFQNGSPEIDRLLHNIWNLSPYIPAFSLGQHFLGGRAWQRYPVSTIMAASLPSHLTFFNDLRELPEELVAPVRQWLDFYKEHSDAFAQTIYPLLADPASDGWTALQSWNPEAGRGALLAFRQKATEDTTTVPLRNVPAGRSFDLYAAPTNTFVGTYTSAELSRGLSVTLPADGARVLLVTPHGA